MSLLTDKSDGKSLCSETNFDLFPRMKVDFAVLQSLKRERGGGENVCLCKVCFCCFLLMQKAKFFSAK